MSYNAYLVDSLGFPRNHHAIFIETYESGPKTGVDFEDRKEIQPELTENFGGLKEFLGIIKKEEYGRVKEVVEGVCPPRKQFEAGRKIYPTEPLSRCQGWTAEAIGALREAGLLG